MTALEELEEWVLVNHEHHRGCDDDDDCCADFAKPYVNSLALVEKIRELGGGGQAVSPSFAPAPDAYALRVRAGADGVWIVAECREHGGVAAAARWDVADVLGWIRDHEMERHAGCGGGRVSADKRDECGCHRTCTGDDGCAVPCRWPECLTEAEAEELARDVFTDLSPADVTRLRRADRGPLPASRFAVAGWNDATAVFDNEVEVRCTLCGECSEVFVGDAVLLPDLTEWAASHRCPGLRVT